MIWVSEFLSKAILRKRIDVIKTSLETLTSSTEYWQVGAVGRLLSSLGGSFKTKPRRWGRARLSRVLCFLWEWINISVRAKTASASILGSPVFSWSNQAPIAALEEVSSVNVLTADLNDEVDQNLIELMVDLDSGSQISISVEHERHCKACLVVSRSFLL